MGTGIGSPSPHKVLRVRGYFVSVVGYGPSWALPHVRRCGVDSCFDFEIECPLGVFTKLQAGSLGLRHSIDRLVGDTSDYRRGLWSENLVSPHRRGVL